MTRVLPIPKTVKDLFEDLLGRSVTVSPADPIRAVDLPKTLVSLFVDHNMQLTALVGMDLPLTANVGAAIGLIPPGGAEACIEDGEISKLIGENIREVLNVLGSLLNQEGMAHLKLHQMFLPGESPPLDAIAHIKAIGRRVDLRVDVAGYGGGKLSINFTN